MKKIIAAIVTALVAVGLVVVGVAAPASAHTATLGGSAACTTGTGAAVVTWTVDNDYNEVVTIDTSDNPAIPALTTLPATNNGPDTIKTFTQTIPAPAAGVSVSATLTFTWSVDNFYQASTTATATVSGDCVPPTPKDASATLTDTDASCNSAETVSEGAVNNASWNGPISYSGVDNTMYTAIATAAANHHFPDAANVTNGGTTKTFSGTLNPKVTTGCTTPPPCISSSNVTYTYSHSDDNDGVITVNDVDGSTHTLCTPFYVTATSWTFTTNTNVWPQNVDVVDKLGEISTPGTYSYAAKVTCGQGDIYASTDATAPSLNPAHYPVDTGKLLGSGNPFAEHFLSQMGFTQTGSTGDTWIVDNDSCWKGTPETGSPSSSVASCTTGSTTINALTLPAVPGGVWTISNTGYTHSYPIGTGVNSLTTPPNGFAPNNYTITLTDGDGTDGYNVTATDSPWSWGPIDTSKCPVYKPTVTDVVLGCTALNGVSTEAVTLTFDNTQSTGTSDFKVPSENIEQEVGPGLSQSVQVTAAGTAGATYDVYINDSATPTVITVPSFDGCVTVTPGTPEVDQQGCTGTVASGGTITETSDTNITYTLVGPTESTTPTTTTPFTTLSGLVAGSYTLTATPATGFLFGDVTAPWTATVSGGVTTWTQTIVIADKACIVNHVVAASTSDPATCSASTTDPVEVDGDITFAQKPGVLIYYVNGSEVDSASMPFADGTYIVTVALTTSAKAAGDVLDAPITWTWNLGPVFCVPTEAAWHANATGVDATCTDGNAMGTINLEHLASEQKKVFYLIKNDATGQIKNAGKTATSVSVPPGVYTVEAKPVTPKDGISGKNVFDITISAPTSICGNTNTLAFTGGTIGTFGLFIAGGMLFLGLAAIYMRRRFGRAAE